MRKMKRLKLRANTASQLSLNLSDTSKRTIIPYGMENAKSKKKDTQDKDILPTEITKEKKQYQHLCLMERIEIQKHLRKGWCLSAIARHLGRGKQSIAVEVRRNGGRDKYNAEKAQKLSMERKIERDLKCSNSIKQKIAPPSVVERIEHLEMQMDILVEAIKKLNGSQQKENTFKSSFWGKCKKEKKKPRTIANKIS